jgi:CMP-N-acetylneuraminic acid synthetase
MIALILARGGSKGVPRKNIKDLNGKPLLSYPIEAAKKTKFISDVYVSTDDEEIASIAIRCGAKVIYRPIELGGDDSLDVDAFRHFCAEKQIDEPIIHLRATTPIIDPKVLDEAITQWTDNQHNYTSLRSAHESSESVFKFYMLGYKCWEPISNAMVDKPRQECRTTYVPNGYIDIVKPSQFITGNFYGDKIYPFITNVTPEIDTLEDFEYIEYLMKKNV